MTMLSNVYDFKIIWVDTSIGPNTKNKILQNPEHGNNTHTEYCVTLRPTRCCGSVIRNTCFRIASPVI